jgi:hypothetical protein
MLPIPTQHFDSEVFNMDNVGSPKKQAVHQKRSSAIMSSRLHCKNRR